MKNLIFAITLILSINVCAQNEFENTNVFVRVYDLQGKKIGKGKILSISETSLQLNGKGEIPVSSIGSIKTKRSAGHNILVLAAVGGAAGGLVVAPFAGMAAYAATGVVYRVAGTAAVAIGAAAAIGEAIGSTTRSKKSKSYEINGDEEKWKTFKEMIVKSRVVARFNFFAN